MSQPLYCMTCDQTVEGEGGATNRCPNCDGPLTEAPLAVNTIEESGRKELSDREIYNVVSDLGTGVNVRVKDNLFQGLAILICLLLGVGIGMLVVKERIAGALVGGFIGLVVGLFGSGIFLMIFRFIMHATGRHK